MKRLHAAFVLYAHTGSHLEPLDEGRDASFFENIDELIDRVGYYLAHDQRETIQQAGYMGSGPGVIRIVIASRKSLTKTLD